MEALTRWIQKETDPTGAMLRVFAWIALALLVIALGAAGIQSLSETPPPEAWGVIGFLLLATAGLGIPALRTKRPAKDQVSLAPLGSAIWFGQLETSLGENGPQLAQAAADWEQAEALLAFAELEPAHVESLRQSGDARMRRMLELTVAPPGRFGLTLEQARAQIEADGRWLTEVRRLIEASREGVATPAEDDALGNLREAVRAREEAVAELRLLA
jgi:hypothetical protein